MKSQSDISKVDKGVKNKFRWEWMQQKDVLGDFFSEYIRKIEKPGKVNLFTYFVIFE